MVERPESVDQALDCLRASQGQAPLLMAGGTDIYPAHVGRAIDRPVLDLTAIADLRTIGSFTEGGDRWLRIGALTTWSDIVRLRHRALSEPGLAALPMAAAEIGGVQIQNRATIGGNLCHASPAADGVPVLQALDAQLELRSVGRSRRLAMTEFVTGPRTTALDPGELLTAILIPLPAQRQAQSVFYKLGHRRYLVISAVMMAMQLQWQGAQLARAAVSVGACGPTAVRLAPLEQQLGGMDVHGIQQLCAQPLDRQWLQALMPIDDLRGTAHYRLDAADTLIRRALITLTDQKEAE